MFTKKRDDSVSAQPAGSGPQGGASRTPAAHGPSPSGSGEPRSYAGRGYSSDTGPGGRQARHSRGHTPATSSVMNPHLKFDGNLKYSGTLTVDCEFRGSICTEDTLIVGSAAKVQAEVEAGVVEISGKIEGNVTAKTRVKILSGGEVHGDIVTPTISMDEGVVFEGRCKRPEPEPEPEAEPPQAPAASSAVQKVLGGAAAGAPETPDGDGGEPEGAAVEGAASPSGEKNAQVTAAQP